MTTFHSDDAPNMTDAEYDALSVEELAELIKLDDADLALPTLIGDAEVADVADALNDVKPVVFAPTSVLPTPLPTMDSILARLGQTYGESEPVVPIFPAPTDARTVVTQPAPASGAKVRQAVVKPAEMAKRHFETVPSLGQATALVKALPAGSYRKISIGADGVPTGRIGVAYFTVNGDGTFDYVNSREEVARVDAKYAAARYREGFRYSEVNGVYEAR